MWVCCQAMNVIIFNELHWNHGYWRSLKALKAVITCFPDRQWHCAHDSNQVNADPRSTYVRCLRVVRRSRVGVRRSSVNLTFWLCDYFLVDSSLDSSVTRRETGSGLGKSLAKYIYPNLGHGVSLSFAKSLEPAEVCPNFQVHSTLGAYYRLKEKSPRHKFINDRKVNVCWTSSQK